MKTLLLFFSDEKVKACPAVVPTLAHVAKEKGIDFETYICTCPMSYGGEMLPLIGNGHMEQFLYLANYYDKILYCALTSEFGFQFRREVLAFGGEVMIHRFSASAQRTWDGLKERKTGDLMRQRNSACRV